MLDREWLQAFLPLGKVSEDGSWTPTGAGVLLHRPPVVWLVTAAHVVPPEPSRVAALVPTTTDGRELVDLRAIQERFKTSWVYDKASDLAATLMPIGPAMKIKAIPAACCVDSSNVVPSMQAYTVGCPYGFLYADVSAPLVQGGVIAGVDPGKAQILTTAPTFPGNSGGPLIVIRSNVSPAGGVTVGRQVVLLAGIVLQMAQIGTYPTNLLSGHTVGGPVLHLGVAVGMERVSSLLESEAARAMTAAVHPTATNKAGG